MRTLQICIYFPLVFNDPWHIFK
ncbi:unnamed protein product, partial [Rotaria sp. Silwood1]